LGIKVVVEYCNERWIGYLSVFKCLTEKE